MGLQFEIIIKYYIFFKNLNLNLNLIINLN